MEGMKNSKFTSARREPIISILTPGKINMEPENTPLEKENHLNQTSIFGLKNVYFPGCIDNYRGFH